VPRLTDQRYSDQHDFIADAWTHHHELFTVLPPAQQSAVHDYHVPSQVLSRDELLAHRQMITKARPSLPGQAGKAYRRLHAVYSAAEHFAAGDGQLFRAIVRHFAHKTSVTVPSSQGRRAHTITASAIVRPTIDPDLLARTLLAIVDDLPPEERERLARQNQRPFKCNDIHDPSRASD